MAPGYGEGTGDGRLVTGPLRERLIAPARILMRQRNGISRASTRQSA